jgi:hypothetical protein
MTICRGDGPPIDSILFIARRVDVLYQCHAKEQQEIIPACVGHDSIPSFSTQF